MAKKKYKVDVYQVLDKDGNVVKELRYPQNPETGKSYLSSDDGTNKVYMPNNDSEELYVAASDAKATTDIDPIAGKVTVTGPKWLTSQIVNSDTFKKNISENSALSSAVSLYQNDQNAKMTTSTGDIVSAADVISDYAKMADSYSKAAAEIISYREDKKKKYGVEFTDEEIAIASSFVDKDDYKGNETIYIPKWMMNKLDWESVGSFDPEHSTVSAADFFDNLYKISLSNQEVEEAMKEAVKQLSAAVDENVYDHDDEEVSAQKTEKFGDKEYRKDLARTIQMYNILTKNRPDATAPYKMKELAAGAVNGVLYYAEKAHISASRAVYDIGNHVAETFSFGNETAATAIRGYLTSNNFQFMSTNFVVGEFVQGIEALVNEGKSPEQAFDMAYNDFMTMLDGTYSDKQGEVAERYSALKADLDARKGQITGWWATGDFIGYMGWKIVENVAFLNPAGKAVEAATGTMFTSIGLKSMLGKIMSPKDAANLITGLAQINNVTAQSMLETFLDDREVVDKAMESGEFTRELWEKFASNLVGNAAGEMALPLAGKGLMKAADYSTIAKGIVMGIEGVTSGIAYVKHSAAAKFFALLNGAGIKNATPEGIAKALQNTKLAPDKRLALFNIGTEFARADAAKNVWKTSSIFRDVDESLADVYRANYGYVFGGSKYLAATTEEAQEAAIKEGIEASTAGTKAALAEDVAKLENAPTPKSAFGENIDKKAAARYKQMRQQILLRANLENQIDAITKGAILKHNEMIAYAGKEWDDFVDASQKVAYQELQLSKAGKVTKWGKVKGAMLSTKEAAEYISLRTQLGRYKWRLEQVSKAGGDWKNAFGSDGKTRIFSSKAEYDAVMEYAKNASERLDALKSIFGEDFTKSLDELHEAAGSFHTKIMEYMGRNEYISKQEYDMFKNLANDKGWGKNGEFYVPTGRLKEGSEYSFFEGNAWAKDPNLNPGRRMANDKLFRYDPGSELDFSDPIGNLQAWFGRQAKIAQAQEYGRALHAVSAPLRKVKGYDMDGITIKEAGIMEKTTKQMKYEYESAFSTVAVSESQYVKSLAEVIELPQIFPRSVDTVAAGSTLAKQKESLAKKEKAIKKLQSEVDKPLFSNGKSSSTIQTTLIGEANDDTLTTLIRSTSTDGEIPIFDPKKVTAGEFKDWYGSLPKSSQEMITSKLNGKNLNVTNVRALMNQDQNFALSLKKNYVNDVLRKNKEFTKSDAYRDFVRTQYQNSVNFRKNTTLRNDIKKLHNMSEQAAKKAGEIAKNAEELDTLTNAYIERVDMLRGKLIDEMAERMKISSEEFNGLLKRFTDRGVDEDLAAKYLILNELQGKSATDLVSSLTATGGKKASIAEGLTRSYDNAKGTLYKRAASLIGDSLESTIKSEYAEVTLQLQGKGVGDLLDNNGYFDAIEKEMDAIEEKYLFTPGSEISPTLNPAQRRKIVELVDENGDLRYYETDPLYATLANDPIGNYQMDRGFLGRTLHGISRIFRFGTTGIDKTSYVNQWFRDPTDAMVIGAYTPMVNLSNGGILSRLAGAYKDHGGLFSEKIFGKFATEKLTDEFVEVTFEASKRGLIERYGQEWFDAMAKKAAGDLTGKEAEAAIKRATAQFATGEVGYKTLPGLGGSTVREFYRAGANNEVEAATTFGISKERAQVVFGGEGIDEAGDYKSFQKIFQEKLLDPIDANLSKGSFREELMRKGVYTSQYRAAIESGMTHKEAQTWATRYALDATTNFSRTFMWGNKFIQSVPYLGAAINGSKSFWRLLEMDPVGITQRFVFGLALPYARMLSLCLSDEQNREAYKNLREYEKDDNLVFVWQGQVITIPAPQALSGFIAPFRHFIEKSADVQDHSWLELIASDALGILPLDMSGFVGLDENELMSDRENGLWTRIWRGVEKAASSLMSPPVKALYMAVSGRDPYTGRNINTSYWREDDEGNLVLVDSSQSEIANWLKKTFNPNDEEGKITATAAEKILKTLFGRSTIGIVENAKHILSGEFDKVVENDLNSYLGPLQPSDYNKARSDWQSAVNTLYSSREALVNNKKFQEAFKVANDKNYSEEKRKEALRVYNEMLDDYTQSVFDLAQNMKSKYPDQYTKVRAAQVVSLLTLPQGLTFNDTAYSEELRQDTYYDARNKAIDTYVKMGFPTDMAGNNMLGSGYYDKYGKFQFKIYTPYQIEALNSTVLGTKDKVMSEIKSALKAADIDRSKMYSDEYYKAKATSKQAKKEYEDAWNTQVVLTLAPIVRKYGLQTVVNNNEERDLLDDYIFVDNPYKTRQYLEAVFEGVE